MDRKYASTFEICLEVEAICGNCHHYGEGMCRWRPPFTELKPDDYCTTNYCEDIDRVLAEFNLPLIEKK